MNIGPHPGENLMSRSPTIIRVMGASRSGTTIVSKSLETIDDAFYLGELDRFADGSANLGKPCVCGRPLMDCPIWSGMTVPADARSLDEIRYASYFDDVYRQISDRTGSTLLIESSKSISHARLMLRSSAFRSIVVHVARDPRGVLNSRSRGWRSPRAVGDPSLVEGARVGLYWNKVNGGIDRLCRDDPAAFFVRYEDFAASPLSFVRQVGASLVHSPAERAWPSPNAMIVERGHAAYGNPSRRTTGTSTIRLDDTWRRLPLRSRVAAWTTAFPMTKKLGYSWRGSSPGWEIASEGIRHE